MAAQVALRRQQEAQLKRHLAQGLMRRGAAPPKAPSRAKKGATRPGVPCECLARDGAGFGVENSPRPAIGLVCDLGQSVSTLWASVSPTLKCDHWEYVVRSVDRKGSQRGSWGDKNSVCSWSGMGVRKKGSSKLPLVLYSWKGEHSTPASDAPWGSPTGTDTPWEGKENLGRGGGSDSYTSPCPGPFLCALNTWVLDLALTCNINSRQITSLLWAKNERVGFYSPPSLKF